MLIILGLVALVRGLHRKPTEEERAEGKFTAEVEEIEEAEVTLASWTWYPGIGAVIAAYSAVDEFK